MTILNGKVIVRAINVGWNDGSEVASIFFRVGSIHGIDQTFGIGITFVTGMRWTIVQHGFVNGKSGLVGEDAGGKHGDELLDLVDAGTFHDIVIDEDVFAEEFDLWYSGTCKERVSELKCVEGAILYHPPSSSTIHRVPID
jgi:hypothetical protein